MQISQDEAMEMLADDEMKHAEAPSDEEMEQMYHRTTQEEIDAMNRASAEQDRVYAERDAHKYCVPERACKACREWFRSSLELPPRKFTYIGGLDRTQEALAEIERENVEFSQARISYHE